MTYSFPPQPTPQPLWQPTTFQHGYQQPPTQKRKSYAFLWWIGGGFLALILVLVLIAGALFISLQPTQLESAAESCGVSSTSLGDNGSTLSLSYEGELDSMDVAELECVLGELGFPDYARNQLGSTRGIDGMQTATWSGITAHWNYDGTNGLSMTFTLK